MRMMRKKVRGAVLAALLLTGALLASTAPPVATAEGDVSGHGAHWKFYTWRTNTAPVLTGSKVSRHAEVGLFDAELRVEAMASNTSPDRLEGGILDDELAIAGLIVVNPDELVRYSWRAEADLPATTIEASVDRGPQGATRGRAEGFASFQVFGDVNWKCMRAVAAYDFYPSARWSFSPDASYTPPVPDASAVTYVRSESKAIMRAMGMNHGGDGHTAVCFRGFVGGDVLVESDWGLSARLVHAQTKASPACTVTLYGFSTRAGDPSPEPEKIADPADWESQLQVLVGEAHPSAELEEKPTTTMPDPPEGDSHDPDDFQLEDW